MSFKDVSIFSSVSHFTPRSGRVWAVLVEALMWNIILIIILDVVKFFLYFLVWCPFYSTENHLDNFGRGPTEEHSIEIILNLGQ